MTSAVPPFSTTVTQADVPPADAARVEADRKKASKDFEAMFLRQALESMLPDSDNAVFGGGTAGGMWRSMLADRVSGVLAERGVLGMAEMLAPTKDAQ